MIVGMDWMQHYSPMRVDWLQKWMVIPYHNSEVTLFGMLPELPAGSVLQVCSVQPEASSEDILPEIQQLISKYPALFEVPTDLPPTRSRDHSIPLVPGASPFVVRPYRFAPHLCRCLPPSLLRDTLSSRVCR